MSDQKPKETQLYLPPGFIKLMKKAAIDRDISTSQLVEKAVLDYVARNPVELPACYA